MEQRLVCYCGKVATVRTSWTVANPGRKFYGCEEYAQKGCGFFKWYDGTCDRCDRSTEIIGGLLTTIRDLELQIKKLEVKRRYIKFVLWVSLAVNIYFLLG